MGMRHRYSRAVWRLSILPVLQQPGGRALLEAQAGAVLAKVPGGEPAVREALAPLLKVSR